MRFQAFLCVSLRFCVYIQAFMCFIVHYFLAFPLFYVHFCAILWLWTSTLQLKEF